MAFLDIEKAFDKVWLDGIISKMINYNYPSTLIKWTNSYLKGRKLLVSINNENSNKHRIKAGVPQGSVLGPKLFNIFMNSSTFHKTNLALFADDTAVYAHSYYAIAAAKQIQIHMDILQKFYKKLKITINAKKQR